jgi:acetyl esterase/lipase
VAQRLYKSMACVAVSASAVVWSAPTGAQPVVSWGQITAQTVVVPDARIQYGADEKRFGDLRLPAGPGPHPVGVVLHGGCWQSEYDLLHIEPVSAALTKAGIATWTLEFRRIGQAGGGWPGTFADVAQGTDYLTTLAKKFPLDLTRVVLIGHSAGGHLALWLAARHNLSRASPLFSASPLGVRGVVSLAGIGDLRAYREGSRDCNASVEQLMGGSPKKLPDRYAQADPIELLPLGVPVRLLHGALDPIVPVAQSRSFAAQARAKGDDAQLVLIENAGHFDVIAPFAPAWASVEQAVLQLLARKD